MNAITISADALRFVRCEKSIDRAIAQRNAAARNLPIKERHAIELGKATIAEAARETLAAWTFRCGELGAIEVPVVAPVAIEAKPARSGADACRVRTMRRFWAVAKSAGLDLKNEEGMKRALSKYFSRPVPSRRDLSIGMWCEAIEGIEFGLLAW